MEFRAGFQHLHPHLRLEPEPPPLQRPNRFRVPEDDDDDDSEEEDGEDFCYEAPLPEGAPAPPAPRWVFNPIPYDEYHTRAIEFTFAQLEELERYKRTRRGPIQRVTNFFARVLRILLVLTTIVLLSWAMWWCFNYVFLPRATALSRDIRHPSLWSPNQTAIWLKSVGPIVASYESVFLQHEVDGKLLFGLKDEDLISMGIDKAIDRKKILVEIDQLKETTKVLPHDFWSYRALHKQKAELLAVAFPSTPRLTILYLYLYEYESTLKPLLRSNEPDVSYFFWIAWVFFPHIACCWYSTAYWALNPFPVIAFIHSCLEGAKVEMEFLTTRNPYNWKWILSFAAPVVHLISAMIFPSWIMTTVFYIAFLYRLFLSVPIIVYTPKRTAKIHWPPPLEIPTNLLDEVPSKKNFICPITQDIMTQPCVANGTSFEYDAIVEWLKTHDTDPVTRQPLTIEDLRPNLALREIIDQWLKKQLERRNNKGNDDDVNLKKNL